MGEHCLRVRNEQLVLNVCRKLSAKDAMGLVMTISSSLIGKFVRKEHLLVWIRGLIVNHAGYLMIFSNVREQLMMLLENIDEKISNYQSLLILFGRLDLIIAQTRIVALEKVRALGSTLSYQELYYSEDPIETE